ncbi:pyridoxal phosphate-dependent decarboxylase family protein [Frondihabitans australicus]|uniref:Glutamate/tyrosine decarboxylase-like PLP-dependent enzyme n=1 Tax=Frondihabitans australicus TaxID=386892 RepID=A0A495IIT4_9MICO|nr:pyridoxal-dependent decarboxylase [Frondihabitans australicus]RKR75221.1 glutamate/tyrosine decarboxylase-like PLP-dependent enzyme [Frondihabitans australicus]
MKIEPETYAESLAVARARALDWIRSLPTRPVAPTADVTEMERVFREPMPESPTPAPAVVDDLARDAEPGIMAMSSGRFFGWVIGGTLPAALGADWMVSAWDQNAGMRYASPAVAALERVAGEWLVDLLGLPDGSDVGFTTGATMANWTALAAARAAVLDAHGWDVNTRGLQGAPVVTVLVGAERHTSVDLALRYLGFGVPTVVESDDEGRIRIDSLRDALSQVEGPLILCLQAGNLHSGAFDPIGEAADLAHEHGGWVHVDGAFGLWAAASPTLRPRLAGLDRADSWATDAHKTLNVPYDCGVAIVSRTGAVQAALGTQTAYLIRDASEAPDPFDLVPEMSRRARGVPVYAALKQLGRSGVEELVDGLVDAARDLADALGSLPGVEVLNDVVFTQVSLAFGSDDETRAVTARLIEDGAVWMSGSSWRGRAILRVSVSNWSTDSGDVEASVAAVARALDAVRAGATVA